jgi:hypothetical protein
MFPLSEPDVQVEVVAFQFAKSVTNPLVGAMALAQL